MSSANFKPKRTAAASRCFLATARLSRLLAKMWKMRNIFSPLSPFHWLQNTGPWMTLNGHFALNSVLLSMFKLWRLAFELSKLVCTHKLVVNHVNVVGRRRNLNRKEQLRHRAVPCDSTAFFLLTLPCIWHVVSFKTRKPCCRKETARCRSCSFRFKVRRQQSLQV